MKVTSLSEFLKIIEDLPRKRGSSLYYRGHPDCSYLLEPSLFRKANYLKNEHLMFKEYLKENPEHFVDDITALDKLVKMQHFGIPTRLLDLTKNPLVSLYFSCVNNDNKTDKRHDGEVVVLSIPGTLIKYNDSDKVIVLSNLCKLKPKEKKFDTSLKREDFNDLDNVGKLIWEIQREKSIFYKNINPRDINSIIPIKVRKNNSRIKMQDGLFLIFGIGKNDAKLQIDSNWIVSNQTKERILIDKDSKYKIKKQLEEISITKNTLFPNLENSANIIKKVYS